MDIVERIKLTAEKKGFKLANLEKELEFGNGTIRKWNNNSPSCDKAIKVANFLNISLDWMITGKDTEKLTEEERELISAFRSVNPEVKKIVKATLEVSRKPDIQQGEKLLASKTG